MGSFSTTAYAPRFVLHLGMHPCRSADVASMCALTENEQHMSLLEASSRVAILGGGLMGRLLALALAILARLHLKPPAACRPASIFSGSTDPGPWVTVITSAPSSTGQVQQAT